MLYTIGDVQWTRTCHNTSRIFRGDQTGSVFSRTANCFQDVPSGIQTQDVPSSIQTQDVPSSIQTQDAPSSIRTQDVTSSIQTQDVPSSIQTHLLILLHTITFYSVE